MAPNPALASRPEVTYVGLDQLFADSDIISLHAPLLPATHHMVNAAAIDKMKPGVMLINTSRGALVDTVALLEGLKARKIGYAGLDVYEEESAYFFEDFSDDILTDDTLARLLTFTNVLVTSHQAFLTREALSNIAQDTLASIAEFAAGKRGAELGQCVARERFAPRPSPTAGSGRASNHAGPCRLVPFLALFGMLAFTRIPAYLATLATMLRTTVLASVIWHAPAVALTHAATEGAVTAILPILWVIFAAIFVYFVSTETGAMDVIRNMLCRACPDLRIQAVLIAFCFGGFLEAVAGFGTAVAIPTADADYPGLQPGGRGHGGMVANSVPVAFGALGIPVIALANVTHLDLSTLTRHIAVQLALFALPVPVALAILADRSRPMAGVGGAGCSAHRGGVFRDSDCSRLRGRPGTGRGGGVAVFPGAVSHHPTVAQPRGQGSVHPGAPARHPAISHPAGVGADHSPDFGPRAAETALFFHHHRHRASTETRFCHHPRHPAGVGGRDRRPHPGAAPRPVWAASCGRPPRPSSGPVSPSCPS